MTVTRTITDGPAIDWVTPDANRYALLAYDRSAKTQTLPTGVKILGQYVYDLTEYVTALTISDSFDQAGARLEITLTAPPPQAGQPDLRSYLTPGLPIRLYGASMSALTGLQPLPDRETILNATLGSADKWELFRGFVFAKTTSSSGTDDTITLTAYDHLIYLSKNRFDVMYKKHKKSPKTEGQRLGYTASHIIRDLCQRAGLKIDPVYFADTQTRLSQVQTYDMTLWDACALALEKTRLATRNSPYYYLRSSRGRVQLILRARDGYAPRAYQSWLLRGDQNILSATHSTSIESLTTSADFVGSRKNSNRKLRARWVNQNGRAQALYGTMHDVVNVGGMSEREFAQTKRNYLLEHQKPDEQIEVSVPCLNLIRAGDAIRVYDDITHLQNFLWVHSVTHDINPSGATTQLTLVRDIRKANYPTVNDGQKQASSGTWSRAKRDGKTIKAGSFKITRFDFSGQRIGTNTFESNDHQIWLPKSLSGEGSPLAGYKRFDLKVGSRSMYVEVARPAHNGPGLRVSTDVCAHLGIGGTGTAEFYPLVPSNKVKS